MNKSRRKLGLTLRAGISAKSIEISKKYKYVSFCLVKVRFTYLQAISGESLISREILMRSFFEKKSICFIQIELFIYL